MNSRQRITRSVWTIRVQAPEQERQAEVRAAEPAVRALAERVFVGWPVETRFERREWCGWLRVVVSLPEVAGVDVAFDLEQRLEQRFYESVEQECGLRISGRVVVGWSWWPFGGRTC